MFHILKRNKFQAGIIAPDYHDSRDYLISTFSLPEEVPEVFDLRKHMPPVEFQGNKGICYAMSVSGIKEYLDTKEYYPDWEWQIGADGRLSLVQLERKWINLSERFIVHATKKISNLWGIQADYFRNCWDTETELLTVGGWKKYNEVKKGDLVITPNLKTKELEVQPIEDVYIYPYQGKLFHFLGQNIDLRVTPEHRCIYKKLNPHNKKEEEKWRIGKVIELPKKIAFPCSSKGWSGKEKKYSDEMIEFMGWFITEGWIGKGYKNNKHLCIGQNKGRKADEIREILNKMGLHYDERVSTKGRKNPLVTFRLQKEDSEKIINKLPFILEKKIPTTFLFELTREQLQKLFDVMVKGDGNIDKGFITFFQKNKETRDTFQVLGILLGYNTRVHNKTVSIKKSKDVYRFKKIEEEYKGLVWSVSVKNGTVILRRNGQSVLTGQSLKAITKYGAPLEEDWKTDLRLDWETFAKTEPPEEVYKKALKYRAKSYWRVSPVEPEIIKRTIYHLATPVLVGMMWNTAYNRPAKDGKLPLPTGKNVGGHAVCVPPETQILTIDGYKPIKDIKEGELVMTHKGNWKRVLRVMKRKFKGKLISVSAHNSLENLRLTGEHPVYIKRATKWYNFGEHKQRQMRKFCERTLRKFFAWIPAKEIHRYDLALTPIPSKKKDIFSKEFAWLLGLYLADGNLKRSWHRGQYDDYFSAVRFSLNREKDKQIIRKLINLMKMEFGLQPSYYYSKRGLDVQVIFYSKDMAERFVKFGGTPKNKSLDFSVINNASPDLVEEILNGWIDGDGCRNEKYWTAFTSSGKLARQIQLLLQKCRWNYSVSKVQMKDFQTSKKRKKWGWNFRGYYNPLKTFTHYWKNNEVKRIEKVEGEYYDGEVWNLEVEDDNSYIAEGLAIHNCSIGWTGDKLWFRNSWGERWGYHGYFYIPEQEFHKHSIWDVWALTDIIVPKETNEGWVAIKYLKLIDVYEKGQLAETTTRLRLRYTPKIRKDNIIKTLKKGQMVEIVDDEVKISNGYVWQKVKVLNEK